MSKKLGNLINNEEFQEMMEVQLNNQIIHLIENDIEFSITVRTPEIKFEPEVQDVLKTEEFALFHIQNYAFDTLSIGDKHIYFRTGIDIDNETVEVKIEIPILSIFQLIVDKQPFFINASAMSTEKKLLTKEKEKTNEDNSRNVFLNNKHNSKFFVRES